MNVVQLITIFQMGVPSEDVPPLKLLNSKNVNHFDSQGCNLSRMKRFMKLIKILAVAMEFGNLPVHKIIGTERQ